MAGVKGLQPRLEQCSLFGGLDAVGGQDRELVAAVLLAQAPDEAFTIVVLRQSRGRGEGEGKRGDEGAGHWSSRLFDGLARRQQPLSARQEQPEHGKIATSRQVEPV